MTGPKSFNASFEGAKMVTLGVNSKEVFLWEAYKEP